MLVLPFRLDGAGGCDRLIPLICRPVPSMASSQYTAIDDPGLPVAVVSVLVTSSQYAAIDETGGDWRGVITVRGIWAGRLITPYPDSLDVFSCCVTCR